MGFAQLGAELSLWREPSSSWMGWVTGQEASSSKGNSYWILRKTYHGEMEGSNLGKYSTLGWSSPELPCLC